MDILYAYNPESRPDDQIETSNAVHSIQNHRIHYAIVKEDQAYENRIKDLWEMGEPFIILEQDIVPTQKDIDDLENCECDFCASKYRLYPRSTGLKEPVYAHRIVEEATYSIINRTRWVRDQDEFCDLYGFGLTKITPQGKYPLTIDRWRDIDSRLSKYTWKHGIKCHLHGEVKHNHR